MDRKYGIGLKPAAHSLVEISISPEQRLPAEALATMKRSHDDLLAGRGADAYGRLTSLASDLFASRPVWRMRWILWQGYAFFEIGENAVGAEIEANYRTATDKMTMAWHIALDMNDIPSQISIFKMLGDTRHNSLEFNLALDDYQTALATLQRCLPASATECALAEINLRSRIARQQRQTGDFASALDSIAIARRLRNAVGAAAMSQPDRAWGEWLEAIIIRSASQQCGGSIPMLRQAIRLLSLAERRIRDDAEQVVSWRRVLIQLAETFVDVAHLYRSAGNKRAFQSNMKRAEAYAILASDALRDTQDEAGRAMTTLVMLRHQLLSLSPAEIIALSAAIRNHSTRRSAHGHFFALRLSHLERLAAQMNDFVLLARIATLRADLLFAGHDYFNALKLYYYAIKTFDNAGSLGEAGRAVLGVRQTLDIM
jgi:hypothetical protein